MKGWTRKAKLDVLCSLPLDPKLESLDLDLNVLQQVGFSPLDPQRVVHSCSHFCRGVVTATQSFERISGVQRRFASHSAGLMKKTRRDAMRCLFIIYLCSARLCSTVGLKTLFGTAGRDCISCQGIIWERQSWVSRWQNCVEFAQPWDAACCTPVKRARQVSRIFFCALGQVRAAGSFGILELFWFLRAVLTGVAETE